METVPKRSGVTWSIPRKRILAMQATKLAAEKARLESALTADERALFEAARANHAGRVVELLAAGVNVNARTIQDLWHHTPAGDTPLIQACKLEAGAAALALIAGGAELNAQNTFGQTGLLWAVRRGMRDVFDALLEAGADPNLATSDDAPSRWAEVAGDTAFIERLIAAGATTKRRN